jgi:hypothetical protein
MILKNVYFIFLKMKFYVDDVYRYELKGVTPLPPPPPQPQIKNKKIIN